MLGGDDGRTLFMLTAPPANAINRAGPGGKAVGRRSRGPTRRPSMIKVIMFAVRTEIYYVILETFL